jgi:deazaflavin-dependent oxidoreductase (nitroreductase family)
VILTNGPSAGTVITDQISDLLSNQEPAMSTPITPTRYLAPDAFTRRVVNPLIAGFTRLGLSVRGSRVLAVRGRTTGEIRTTPVNLLTVDGERYLVAPRGTTQWVRNVRVAGECELRLGRRSERVAVVELGDADKPAILRDYLHLWKREVGQFFDGVGPDATDAELLAIAPGYPVFRLTPPFDR